LYFLILHLYAINIPYYPTVQKLEVIEKNTNDIILQQDLNSFNSCNANNVCEFERGENGSSCIADCGVSSPKYSKETQQLFNSNNGEIKDSNGAVVLKENKAETTFSWAAIIAGVVIMGGILAFIIIKKRRHE
jgi:hypothetical protein